MVNTRSFFYWNKNEIPYNTNRLILQDEYMKNLQNIKIERIWYGWVWIAKLEDGKKLLIKWWALPWSIVDVNITKKHSDYLEWHIAKIHEYDKSFLDNEIFCPHFFSTITRHSEERSDEESSKILHFVQNDSWYYVFLIPRRFRKVELHNTYIITNIRQTDK